MQNFKLLSSLEGFDKAFGLPANPPSLSFSLYGPGLPLGALTQLLGPGSTEAILRLSLEHPKEKFAWVEQRLSAYPPAFVQHGANLNCLLFVESGEYFDWALVQLLRSQIFKVVVAASALKGDEIELKLRRLQLAAKHSQSALIFTCENDGPHWPLKLKLQAKREGEAILLSRQDAFEENQKGMSL
jgi:hypothetical protein